jgi:succinate dehydrogenase/fumarate reductase flavoprotein subunit
LASSDTVAAPVTRLTESTGWQRTVDVVVVGSGIAGLATAVHAAALGASAIVVEKGERCGGTSAKAAAGMMVPRNRYQRALGQDDPKEDFIRFLARIGRPLLYDPSHPRYGLQPWEYDLIDLYWDNAAASVERLEELGALTTVHAPDWPSYNEVAEDRARFGRVLFTLSADGELGTGVDCVARLVETAQSLGVEVRTGHRVSGVVVDEDGAVLGVSAQTSDGPVALGARKAVVFASGGFAHNQALRRE